MALAAGGGRARITGKVHLVFVVFGCWKHSFTPSSGYCVLSSFFWFLTLTLRCQMANEKKKILICFDVSGFFPTVVARPMLHGREVGPFIRDLFLQWLWATRASDPPVPCGHRRFPAVLILRYESPMG